MVSNATHSFVTHQPRVLLVQWDLQVLVVLQDPKERGELMVLQDPRERLDLQAPQVMWVPGGFLASLARQDPRDSRVLLVILERQAMLG